METFFYTSNKDLNDETKTAGITLRLQKVINRVYAVNPFYRNKLLSAGYSKCPKLKTIKDFRKLPFTTKEELLQDQKAKPIFGTNLADDRSRLIYGKSTSGTSGKGRLMSLFTRRDFNGKVEPFAKELRKIVKPKKGETAMCIMSYGAFLYVNPLLQEMGYFCVSPEVAESNDHIIETLSLYHVNAILITPTKLFQIMQKARELGINLKNSCQIRTILFGGESISESARKTVEDVWGARCLSTVASSEAGHFGQQCDLSKNSVHLINNVDYYEIIDPKTNCHADKGELVVTTFYKKDCPYIRYKTGDYAEIILKSCPCGYPSPRIVLSNFHRFNDHYRINNRNIRAIQLDNSVRKFVGYDEYLILLDKEEEQGGLKVLLELTDNLQKDQLAGLKKDLHELTGISVVTQVLFPGAIPRQLWKSKRIIDLNNPSKNILPGNDSYIQHKIKRVIDRIKCIRYNH